MINSPLALTLRPPPSAPPSTSLSFLKGQLLFSSVISGSSKTPHQEASAPSPTTPNSLTRSSIPSLQSACRTWWLMWSSFIWELTPLGIKSSPPTTSPPQLLSLPSRLTKCSWMVLLSAITMRSTTGLSV